MQGNCGDPPARVWRLPALAAAVLAASLVAAPAARAFEDQVSLDLALGYGVISEAPALTHAGGADFGASFGLGPVLNLRALVGGQLLSAERGPVRGAGRLLGELSYAFDVLSVVPAVGLGASVGLLSRPDEIPRQGHDVIGGPHLVLSLDYLLSRALNVGLDLREQLLFRLGQPSFASEGRLRLSWLFELY